MSVSRNQILEKKKRLEQQKEKDELALKLIQERLKKTTENILEAEKKEDLDRKRIAGEFIFEKMKKDSSFKVWFDGEISSYLKSEYEKNLFGLLVLEKEGAKV